MGEQSSRVSGLGSLLSSIQDVGWSHCHLRACLGLGGLLPQRLTPVATGWRPQLLHMGLSKGLLGRPHDVAAGLPK